MTHFALSKEHACQYLKQHIQGKIKGTDVTTLGFALVTFLMMASPGAQRKDAEKKVYEVFSDADLGAIYKLSMLLESVGFSLTVSADDQH